MDRPFDLRTIKAVIFDIDGTLYRQGPLRRGMLWRLLAAHATRPWAGWQTMTVLKAYRHAQEELRERGGVDVATAQLALTCERTRTDRDVAAACVERWMEREPLTILQRYVQPGLVSFLEACRTRGLRLATLSDYPGDEKLRALGVAEYFHVTLCAQEPEIAVFKPNPKGLQVALERLGVSASEAVYVGDRAEVDAAAADAAGMHHAILASEPSPAGSPLRLPAGTYPQLQALLLGAGARTQTHAA